MLFTKHSCVKTLVIAMKKTLLFFLMVAVLCSCRTLHPDRMFKASKKFEPTDFIKPPDEYIISSGDILAIQVFANKGYELVNWPHPHLSCRPISAFRTQA